jgi:hypothetical protein
MAHFILDYPGYFLAKTFSFQVGIVRRTARRFLDLALHFVNLAFFYILGARLHLVISSALISIPAQDDWS